MLVSGDFLFSLIFSAVAHQRCSTYLMRHKFSPNNQYVDQPRVTYPDWCSTGCLSISSFGLKLGSHHSAVLKAVRWPRAYRDSSEGTQAPSQWEIGHVCPIVGPTSGQSRLMTTVSPASARCMTIQSCPLLITCHLGPQLARRTYE